MSQEWWFQKPVVRMRMRGTADPPLTPWVKDRALCLLRYVYQQSREAARRTGEVPIQKLQHHYHFTD